MDQNREDKEDAEEEVEYEEVDEKEEFDEDREEYEDQAVVEIDPSESVQNSCFESIILAEDEKKYENFAVASGDLVTKEASERVTSDRMTHYEYTNILGRYAAMLAETNIFDNSLLMQGSITELKSKVPVYDSAIDIARELIARGITPFVIKRCHSDGTYELWRASELGLPQTNS